MFVEKRIYVYINKENHLNLLTVVNHLQVNNEYSNEVLNVFLMLVQHNYSHVEQIFSRKGKIMKIKLSRKKDKLLQQEHLFVKVDLEQPIVNFDEFFLPVLVVMPIVVDNKNKVELNLYDYLKNYENDEEIQQMLSMDE